MKKCLLVLNAIGLLLFTHQSFSSTPNLTALSQAENSCDADLYGKFLQFSHFSPLVVSNSLANIIYKCHKSGNLAKMMHVNANNGGSADKSEEFTRNAESVFPDGYSASPLGFLQLMQAKSDLTDAQSQDITQAINIIKPPLPLKPFILSV